VWGRHGALVRKPTQLLQTTVDYEGARNARVSLPLAI
jgi:hypothetical protein